MILISILLKLSMGIEQLVHLSIVTFGFLSLLIELRMYEGAKLKSCLKSVLFKCINIEFLHHVYQYRHFSLRHVLKGIPQAGHFKYVCFWNKFQSNMLISSKRRFKEKS